MDWAFASSVPMAELLTTPGLPHPKDDTEPSLTAAFRAGFTNHLEREESKIVLPAVWEGHEKGVAFYKIDQFGCLAELQTLQGAVRISFRGNKQLIYLQISVNSIRKLPFQIWQNYFEADDQPPSVNGGGSRMRRHVKFAKRLPIESAEHNLI